MSFFRGFQYAFSGWIHCVKNERNMRFHTVAGLYVLIFARFFHFSRGEYILLLLTILAVLALEGVNTAVEELCDKVSPQKDEHIRHAKDAAAGAVLIAACFAVVIGVILFWDSTGWLNVWHFYTTHPLHLAALLVLTVLSVLFVFAIPHKAEDREPFRQGKGKWRRNRKNDRRNR